MNIKKIVYFLVLLLFFLPLSSRAQSYKEQIDGFDVLIEINEDASFDVTETIVYNFGDQESHGIYRSIPYKYQDAKGDFKLRLKVQSVKDENDIPWNYETYKNNGYQYIKIGDANTLVTGEQTYIIKYNVLRAIGSAETYDELYWNVTGDMWEVPINQVSARVVLPQTINNEEAQVSCYTGAYGENTGLCQGVFAEDTYAFAITSPLSHYEGLTISAAWPKGIVEHPSVWIFFVQDNWSIILIPFTLFLMIWLYMKKGRDPKGRGTIIAQFDPPDNLNPEEVGTIVDEKASYRELTSTIINLAVKGYLTIAQKGKKDFSFTRTKKEVAGLSQYETDLLNNLVPTPGGTKDLSDHKQKFATHVQNFLKEVYKTVITKGYFIKNPSTSKILYLVVGIIVASFVAPMLGGFLNQGVTVFSVVTCGAIITVFSFFMGKRTKKGVLAKEHIKGLELYLTVAEKDRLEFHNAPEKSPKEFERLLPYAIALGVEEKWAEAFKDLQMSEPDWYHGNYGTFNSVLFASSISNFAAASQSNLGTTASSGGSGVGGGGFSGGGFGGGGGGSW
ncbi:MAG: DUF2207 domain-containing protein [bacterium]